MQEFLTVDLVGVSMSMERLEGLVMAVVEEETATYLMAAHTVLPIQIFIWVEAQVVWKVSMWLSP